MLKRADAVPAHTGQDIRDTVSAILADIERRGEDAVRDWSLKLDGWAPDSFVVAGAEVDAAAAAVPDDLKQHIAFAQEQVGGFAESQRGTLTDLERRDASGRSARPPPRAG